MCASARPRIEDADLDIRVRAEVGETLLSLEEKGVIDDDSDADTTLGRLDQMLEEEEAHPEWAKVSYPRIDYDEIVYYSAPKQKKKIESLDEIDPEDFSS